MNKTTSLFLRSNISMQYGREAATYGWRSRHCPNPNGVILVRDVLLSVTGYSLLPNSSFASP